MSQVRQAPSPLPPQVGPPPLWVVGPVVGWGSQLSEEPGKVDAITCPG